MCVCGNSCGRSLIMFREAFLGSTARCENQNDGRYQGSKRGWEGMGILGGAEKVQDIARQGGGLFPQQTAVFSYGLIECSPAPSLMVHVAVLQAAVVQRSFLQGKLFPLPLFPLRALRFCTGERERLPRPRQRSSP